MREYEVQDWKVTKSKKCKTKRNRLFEVSQDTVAWSTDNGRHTVVANIQFRACVTALLHLIATLTSLFYCVHCESKKQNKTPNSCP